MVDSRRVIRQFEIGDESAIAEVWYRSGVKAYSFLPTWQEFKLEQAHEIVRKVIVPKRRIWVGTCDSRIVAFLAMDRSIIDRMYAEPSEWRKGWGRRFIDLAKSISPDGLELYTHQENHSARVLYEKHGFRVVEFGVSPPPESAPDVMYRWMPSGP
jgi:GNAT superfamily N-acetyltransferase